MMNKKKGKLIVFEGIDGCGKDYHMDKLRDWLINQQNISAVNLHFPSFSQAGYLARQLLRDEEFMSSLQGTPLQDTYINALCAVDTLYQTYKPKVGIVDRLIEGTWVLTSRYIFSSLVYYDHTKASLNYMFDGYRPALIPDLTIVLDCPATVALERLENRGDTKTYHEKLDKLKVIRDRYKTLPSLVKNLGQINVVSTNQPKHSAEMEIIKYIKELMNNDNEI